MKEILKGKKLILGSQSPRRSRLLADLDLPFTKTVRSIDESFPEDMPAEEVAEYLARKKGEAFLHDIKSDEIVLTADSVVIIDHQILGKPVSLEDAQAIIGRLSGRIHRVITGVCLTSTGKIHSFSETSDVKIAPLSEKEIQYYVNEYKPMDKAGAYGIQEWIGHAKIEWIKGTYTNIMGLPTHKVYQAIESF